MKGLEMTVVKLSYIQKGEVNAFCADDSFGFRDYWESEKSLEETIIEVASNYQEGPNLLIRMSRDHTSVLESEAIREFQRDNILGISFSDADKFHSFEQKLRAFTNLRKGYKRTRRFVFNHIFPEKRSTVKVWTDGSYNYETKKAGWAWCHGKAQASGSLRVENDDISFQAELEAIRQALNSHRHNTVTVYTDCRAIIQKFREGDEILDEFSDYSFSLRWVKGHADIPIEFNIVADYLSRAQTH